MVSTERDAKIGVKTLLAMQFKKGFNKSEPYYLAVTRLKADEGSSKVEVPKVIERVLDEFKDVIPKELPKKLPPMREVDHTIKLEPGSKPPAKAPYRMPPPELEELRNQLKELMDVGYIRPSKSPYGASVLFQKKKDGSLRMCIDYRALKKVTIKNKYPIPLIADLFDQLGKARYFTKLDLRSGYYQVRIAEGDEAKTTHTLEEHALHLKQIKDGGLMMDGAKIKAIQDWESPTKVTELRSFLGLVNYYRRVPSGVREFEEGGYGRAGVETTGCDHAFRVTHECIRLCYWRSSNAIWKPDRIREPEVKRDGKEVHGAREIDDGGCLLLQDLKIEQKKLGGLLEPLPTPKGPWESVSMDFITCLPKSEGGGSIIVVVDRFSKYGTFIAAPPDVTADDTAKLFFKNVVKYWEVPHVIVSDRDPRFTGRFWTELFKIIGTDLKFSMSFHPPNGRANREGECTIEALSSTLSTGKSPFELVMGLRPLTPNALAASYEGSSSAAYKTMKEWHEQADLARASLDKSAKKMKKLADERRRHVEFEVGDQVMVKLLPQQFKSLRKVYKELIRRYEGPFPVIGRVGKQVGKRKTYCGSLRTRSRDITRMARRGRRELRRLSGILRKVEKLLEALGNSWKT
ncbi:mediator of RNA polymerase II transcription subunit 12 [Tanacetum coccineum]